MSAIKAKKKGKKAPGTSASTMPEDYEFGSTTTSFTAGSANSLNQMATSIAQLQKEQKTMEKRAENHWSDTLTLTRRTEQWHPQFVKQQDIINRQQAIIEQQQASIDALTTQITSQQASIDALANQIASQHASIEILMTRLSSSPSATYAAVTSASLPPSPPSTNPPSPPPTRSPTPSLTCTIDLRQMSEEEKTPLKIRKGIESEVQKELGSEWKCTAVLRDRPNTVKIICNTKEELEKIKKAATTVPRAKLATDPLYPIKIDNVRASTVLYPDGTLKKDEMKEALSDENRTEITRIGWLSVKQSGKAFGSMVVYLTKRSEALRILQKGYFDVGGESAYARPFTRTAPRCFNCQRLGHSY